jgi:hypothetical protein
MLDEDRLHVSEEFIVWKLSIMMHGYLSRIPAMSKAQQCFITDHSAVETLQATSFQ